MTDPTITITSLGERGVESVFGIIYPPQLALVGFGKVVERPWVVDGGRRATRVTATLAGDHRATDGHRGALLSMPSIACCRNRRNYESRRKSECCPRGVERRRARGSSRRASIRRRNCAISSISTRWIF